MSTPTSKTHPTSSGALWGLALLPVLLLGLVLTYLVATGGGLTQLSGPPVEKLRAQRVTLPRPGMMTVEVINDGPEELTIAQIQVDDAFWTFSAAPSTTLPRFGAATFSIPYPWVREEAHVIVLLTTLGTTFPVEVPVAVQTPQIDAGLLLRFALVGLYVGVVPVALGLLWYPFMKRMGRRAMNTVLALTIGLLGYLAIGTYLDAQEFAIEVPTFWQGVPLVIISALITFGAITALGNMRRRGANPADAEDPLRVSYQMAFGIGLHNLGEGLAIGASFAAGQAALGTLLMIGFTLHNITEGVGIAAPIITRQTALKHFVLMALLAGAPAIAGTLIGSLAFSPVLAVLFLGIGLGAIVQVIIAVGRLMLKDSRQTGEPLINWPNFGGLLAGVAIMYFTAFLVKF